MFFFKKQKLIQSVNTTDKVERLRLASQATAEEIFQKYETEKSGLNASTVNLRQETQGKNIISQDKGNTRLSRFRQSLLNPFNIILFIIAIVNYLTDVVFSSNSDYATVIIILVMILLSAVISYVQSRNSDKATESLKSMVANTCTVLRDGRTEEINIEDVVVGDILMLSSGDMFPADVRLIETKDLFISQSALTGESQPVERFSDPMREDEKQGISDLDNIGLLGADVVSGSALAVVIAIGDDTYFSSVAHTVSTGNVNTRYSRSVRSISKLLLQMLLLVVPMIFLINGILKQDWLQALLFTVSIAVGLTPELLPVIMTTTLSRGAVKMSREKVIVRNLSAMQSFGEMDVLCTDKTGTLTEDKIIVERYMDLHGNDDTRVLRHAFLNSTFQTGLKNLIDIAIINRAKLYGLDSILGNYERKDEIPFDFNRRRMSVVVQDKMGKRQLVTKGAVEEMIGVCSFAEIEGAVIPLGQKEKEIALNTYQKHNKEGLRMIAVAQKNNVPDENKFSVADESDMVLIGFIGFLDPPKKSAAAAIRTLQDHGVRTIVLTGDSEGVAKNVCSQVGVNIETSYDGNDVEAMSDKQLLLAVEKANLFSKLSPIQKERVIKALQANGHTVGYLGDGINDTPALRAADVGVSVDTAVDIAKESADFVLLEKDLMVLERGIEAGRETFGNMMKYLYMALSGNLGNIISVMIASIFLPFLPILPVQLLAQNLLNDVALLGMAFDHVDPEYIRKPKSWDVPGMKRFMLIFGSLSAVFDVLLFGLLYFAFGFQTVAKQAHFQSAWFLFGTLSQIMSSYVIRTGYVPFTKSKPDKTFMYCNLTVAVLVLVLCLSPMAIWLDMAIVTLKVLPVVLLNVLLYVFMLEKTKDHYIKKHRQWI